jgi:phage tail-like protein
MPLDREMLTNSRFYLELSLDGSDAAFDAVFKDCKGFKTTQDVIEACEVTTQKWGTASRGGVVRTKIPGNVKYTNLILMRGLSSSRTLWNWFELVQEGNWAEQRRDGSLNIYNLSGDLQARYEFSRAWPARYSIADLNAGGAEIEIEEMELAVEELKRVS